MMSDFGPGLWITKPGVAYMLPPGYAAAAKKKFAAFYVASGESQNDAQMHAEISIRGWHKDSAAVLWDIFKSTRDGLLADGIAEPLALAAAQTAYEAKCADIKRNEPTMLQRAASVLAPMAAVIGGPAGYAVAGALTASAAVDYSKQNQEGQAVVDQARGLAPQMNAIFEQAVSANDFFARLDKKVQGAAAYWRSVPGFEKIVADAYTIRKAAIANTRGLSGMFWMHGSAGQKVAQQHGGFYMRGSRK